MQHINLLVAPIGPPKVLSPAPLTSAAGPLGKVLSSHPDETSDGTGKPLIKPMSYLDDHTNHLQKTNQIALYGQG